MKKLVCKLLLTLSVVAPIVTPLVVTPAAPGQDRVIRLYKVFHRRSAAHQWEVIIVEGESTAQRTASRYRSAGEQSYYEIIR